MAPAHWRRTEWISSWTSNDHAPGRSMALGSKRSGASYASERSTHYRNLPAQYLYLFGGSSGGAASLPAHSSRSTSRSLRFPIATTTSCSSNHRWSERSDTGRKTRMEAADIVAQTFSDLRVGRRVGVEANHSAVTPLVQMDIEKEATCSRCGNHRKLPTSLRACAYVKSPAEAKCMRRASGAARYSFQSRLRCDENRRARVRRSG